MRAHDVNERQLEIREFARFEQAQGVRLKPRPRPLTADANVYGEDFALVTVRDGFYADELRVYYVSRGRVYVVRSPRMRAGQGFRRVDGLPAGVRPVDEAEFNPDDGDDQALFAVADCIDGID